MKEVFKNRLKRLEDAVRAGDDTLMIALQDGTGFQWNGNTFRDQRELSAAVRLSMGDNWELPLLILSKIHDMGGANERPIQ
jgi:hypothetical protein